MNRLDGRQSGQDMPLRLFLWWERHFFAIETAKALRKSFYRLAVGNAEDPRLNSVNSVVGTQIVEVEGRDEWNDVARQGFSQLDVLKFPAFAKIGFDELVGFLIVGEPQIRAIPEELLVWEPPTDGAE